jgi:hypothetical protein
LCETVRADGDHGGQDSQYLGQLTSAFRAERVRQQWAGDETHDLNEETAAGEPEEARQA